MTVAKVRQRGLRRYEWRAIEARLDGRANTRLAFELAVMLGITGKEIVALNIGDISADGANPRAFLKRRQIDRRRRQLELLPTPLVPGLAARIVKHLDWRRSLCRQHETAPPGSARRCRVCGQPGSLLDGPLFMSRWSRRLSQRQLQRELAFLRDAAHLDGRISFDDLARTDSGPQRGKVRDS